MFVLTPQSMLKQTPLFQTTKLTNWAEARNILFAVVKLVIPTAPQVRFCYRSYNTRAS